MLKIVFKFSIVLLLEEWILFLKINIVFVLIHLIYLFFNDFESQYFKNQKQLTPNIL